MSLMTKCSVGLTVAFWQLVTLSVFAYGVGFMFWPVEANDLFLIKQSTSTVRFMGVLFLLSAAGLNQMVYCSSNNESSMMSRMAFSWTIVLYLCASAGGIVVTNLDEQLFIDEQNMAFLILFSLFAGALLIGFVGTLSKFCKFKTKASVQLEAVVEVPSAKKTAATKKGVSRSMIASGNRA